MPRDVRTPVRNNTPKRRRKPKPKVDRGSIEYQRAHRPAPSKQDVRARRKVVKARPKAVPGAGVQTGRGKQRRLVRNTNNPFKGTTKRPLAGLEKAQARADRKVYRAATKLPEKAKYRELERLYKGQTRRRQERELEDATDDLRKRYGLEPRDKDTKVLGFNLEAELEGRGRIAKGASRVKKLIDANQRSSKYNTAGIAGGDVLNRAGKDLVDVFAQAPAGGYALGAGAVEAAQGRPARIKEQAKQVKEHDPIVLAAQGKFKQAGKEISKHPGLAALEVAGVGGTVSRGAGSVGRSGVLGRRAKSATSTKRAPKVAPGTGVKNRQSYSRGVVGKAAQVHTPRVGEKARVKRAKRLYKESMQARQRGDTQDAAGLRAKAQSVNPYRVPEKALRTRYDRREGLAEPRRRLHRTAALKEVDATLPDKHESVALLLAQNIVKPDRGNLEGYLKSLEVQHSKLRSKPERITNERLRKQIRTALDDQKLDLPALAESGKRYAAVAGAKQKAMVERDILTEGAGRMAKLIPSAVREMGAKFEEGPFLTPAGERKVTTKRLRDDKANSVLRARRVEEKARRDYQRAFANARVSTARNKRTPELKEAERKLRAATADLARERRRQVGAARKEGAATDRATRAERAATRSLLRKDKDFRQTENRLRSANQEKGKARKRLRNVERAPSLYSRGDAEKARGAVKKAEEKSSQIRASLTGIEARLRAQAQQATTRVARRSTKPGDQVAAQIGRVPTTALSRMESARGREEAVKAAIGERKSKVQQAESAVAAERRRIRGVEPSKADALLRAIAETDAAKAGTGVARQDFERARGVYAAARVSGRGKATHDKARFVTEGRTAISGAQMEARLRATGVDPKDIGFVTQHPSALGAGAYYQSWQTPKGLPGKTRTGEATRRGTFTVDRETGRANIAKMQGLVDASKEFEGFINEFGYRQGKGVKPYATREAAVKDKNRLEASGSQYEWQPVAVKPMFGGDRQARKLLDDVNADLPRAAREAAEAALRGEEGAPSYVLVPNVVADQMSQHMKVLDPTVGGKALRVGTQQFKNVVLTTSTTWPTGNIMEASLRSLVNRAGPRSYALGKRTIRELKRTDPGLAEELVTRIGEGHFGMQELQAIHTTAKSFRGTRFEPVAKALGTVRRTPGPKQVADLWGAYTRFIFGTNGLIEQQFKTAMLGAHARREIIDRKGIVNLEKAAKQAADGLKGTNEQFAAAEAVARAYGRYEGFSPSGRRIKAQYTPFAAWAVNATKFLVDVLPRDHPTVTALLAANQRATEQWQKEIGLDQAPGWLKGSIPAGDRKAVKGGDQWVRVGRYTPFSLAGDPLGTASGQLLPQMQGVVMNLKGLDWKGKPLAGKDRPDDVTDAEKRKAALNTLLGEAVPFWGQVERSKKKGVKGVANPFNPVSRQDPRVDKAFKRDEEIEAALDKLPTLDEAKEGSPEWRKRRKLLDERNALSLRIKKLSKGKYRKSAGGSGKKSGGFFGGGASSGSSSKAKSGGFFD